MSPSTVPLSVARQATSIFAVLAGYAALALVLRLLWTAPAPSGAWLAASAVLAATLATLTVIDLATFRLPDRLTLPLVASGLGLPLLFPTGPDIVWRALAGLGAFLVLAAVCEGYLRLRGRAGLGLGDAKLFAAAGTWLGVEPLPTALLVACLTALAAVGIQCLKDRTFDTKQHIAFGPFLAIGFWLCWLLSA